MNIFEKIRDIWEIVVIERFPRVIRNLYYTKVTKWPKEFDKESLLRFSILDTFVEGLIH